MKKTKYVITVKSDETLKTNQSWEKIDEILPFIPPRGTFITFLDGDSGFHSVVVDCIIDNVDNYLIVCMENEGDPLDAKDYVAMLKRSGWNLSPVIY